ncbi:MAG: hypothetical protein ACXABY_13530 [Candidatus Thorarchaeota archaeon]|jgi:hypothetical protein
MAKRSKSDYRQQEASAVRPVSTLDKRAMALDIYDGVFHKKSRRERSAIVHKVGGYREETI